MKKCLVSGSLGLVGSESVTFFHHKGWEVYGIDTNMRSHFFNTPKHEDLLTLDIDIRDEQAITKLFSEHKFDAIIHAAAQPSHDWSTEHILEDFEINAKGTIILLEATRKYCPDAVFVHVSTDKVYGENMQRDNMDEGKMRYESKDSFLSELSGDKKIGGSYNEELGLDFVGHRSFFGCSKTAADIYAQEYANEFGLKIGIFRPGCITGKNHEGAEQHGFFAYLVKCIKNGTKYKIFGNGKTVRDQIHAYDLVNAFWHFIENPKSGAVYNIGGGPDRSVSILEAIQLIEAATAQKCSYEFHEERAGDRRWDVHDVSKFKRDYPEWSYKYSLQAIIDDLCS